MDKSKRINVTIPVDVLKNVDEFRKKYGVSRSAFFRMASLEKIEKHEATLVEKKEYKQQ